MKNEIWKSIQEKRILFPPLSISAHAAPAVAQHHASFLPVSWAKLMLGIEIHKVDL